MTNVRLLVNTVKTEQRLFSRRSHNQNSYSGIFKQNSLYDLAKLDDYQIGKMGRLTDPMYLPKVVLIMNPSAGIMLSKKIAEHLNALESPDEAAFYTSGEPVMKLHLYTSYLQKEFGTNNMPDCSNMCHETSGSALRPTIGIGKGTVTLEDFHDSEVIVIIGQNPGTNAPRMMSALAKAKKERC